MKLPPHVSFLPQPKTDAVLVRIEAPHCVAGIEIEPGGKVVRAAPILRFMLGWDGPRVKGYCRRKGWDHQVIVHIWSHAKSVAWLRKRGIIR